MVSLVKGGCLMWKQRAFASAVLAAALGCGGASKPPEPFPQRIRLSFADSVCGPAEAEGRDFGYVVDACLGPSGELLVLDQARCRIEVFSPRGGWTGSLGRRGQGPGEMVLPMYLENMGDLIMVQDGARDGYMLWNDSHELEDEVLLWPRNAPMSMRRCGSDSLFAAYKLDLVPGDGRIFMARSFRLYRLGAAEAERVLFTDTVDVDPADFTSILSQILWSYSMAADADGRVYIAPMSSMEYRVTALSHGGDSLFTIDTELPRARKSELEMEDERLFVEGYMSSLGISSAAIDWQPDHFRNMVAALGLDSRGRLWVQRGTEPAAVFDVYDPENGGGHVFSAQLPRASRSWRSRICGEIMLAWEEDPADGKQRIYLIELPDAPSQQSDTD